MSIKNIITKRKTLKVLSKNALPIITDEVLLNDLKEMVAMAGKAPFHYPASSINKNTDLCSVAPWRFYILDTKTCRKLAQHYTNNNIKGGKIIQMLNSASALIQATWIPESNINEELTMNSKNIEHIAATSAAIQNMLLVATEMGYHNYWSSGGTLRETYFKDLLKIPTQEQLLGSIFIFSEDVISKTEQVTGAWRDKQGSIEDFSCFVNI